MPKVIQLFDYGSPDVMTLEEIKLPELHPTELRFQVLAAAVNRADCEIRSGNWPILTTDPFLIHQA